MTPRDFSKTVAFSISSLKYMGKLAAKGHTHSTYMFYPNMEAHTLVKFFSKEGAKAEVTLSPTEGEPGVDGWESSPYAGANTARDPVSEIAKFVPLAETLPVAAAPATAPARQSDPVAAPTSAGPEMAAAPAQYPGDDMHSAGLGPGATRGSAAVVPATTAAAQRPAEAAAAPQGPAEPQQHFETLGNAFQFQFVQNVKWLLGANLRYKTNTSQSGKLASKEVQNFLSSQIFGKVAQPAGILGLTWWHHQF